MRKIVFSSIIVLTAMAGPGATADNQQPVIEIPEHGLGLLLETPGAPLRGIYGERTVPT